jgi:hypothetical protein
MGGSCDGQSLRHAPRGGPHRVAPTPPQPYLPQRVFDARISVRHIVHAGVEAQVLLGAQVVVEQGFVRDQPNLPPHLDGAIGQIVTRHADRSSRRFAEGGQYVHQRGFARAVRSDQGEEFALGQVQVHAF